MTEPLPELVVNGRFLTQATTGVQRVAQELVRAFETLIASGEVKIKIRLLCERHADTSALNLRNIEVVRIGHTRGHLWEQFTLPRYVGKAKLLCLGNTAPIIPLLFGRPVAVMLHDLSYRLYPESYSLSYRAAHSLMQPFLLRRARPILTVAETEKEMLASLMPCARYRIVVAQNGAWRNEIASQSAVPTDRTGSFALYVGSLSPRKNFEGVLAVAKRLARERQMRTVLVGTSGPFLRAPEIKIEADVRPYISFVGQLEDSELLREYYSSAACLLFPSFYEASPLPPLEAMTFGCPVIASDTLAMRERCGDAVEYCDPQDRDDIFAAVLRVVEDPEHAADLVARGYERIHRFSWLSQARTILAALNIG